MLFGKKRSKQSKVYSHGWEYDCSCPRCGKKYHITSTDLVVVCVPDFGGVRDYYFKVRCAQCERLTIVIPKDDIPYDEKENVLAETQPIVVSGCINMDI